VCVSGRRGAERSERSEDGTHAARDPSEARGTPRGAPIQPQRLPPTTSCAPNHYTYGLAVTLSNCSNNYGPYQFPEKLIPPSLPRPQTTLSTRPALRDTRISLELEVRRVDCTVCGKVKQKRLDWLSDNPFSTKRFAFFVGRRCRAQTITDVAQETRLDWKTVKELDKQYIRAQLPHRGQRPAATKAELVRGQGSLGKASMERDVHTPLACHSR